MGDRRIGGRGGGSYFLVNCDASSSKKRVEAVFNVCASISVPVTGLLMSLLFMQLTNKIIE